MRLVVAVVLGALVGAAAALGASSPYTAARTTACLASHKGLTQSLKPAATVPAGTSPKPVAAITVGFPFVSGPAALDSATVLFTSTPATGAQLYKKVLAWNYASAAQVQGISQTKAREQIRKSVMVRGNVVVAWRHIPHASTRATVLACLR